MTDARHLSAASRTVASAPVSARAGAAASPLGPNPRHVDVDQARFHQTGPGIDNPIGLPLLVNRLTLQNDHPHVALLEPAPALQRGSTWSIVAGRLRSGPSATRCRMAASRKRAWPIR